MRKWLAAVSAIALSSFALAGCAVNERNLANEDGASQSSHRVFSGAGASAQEAAQSAWIASFQQQDTSLTVNYNPVGSGNGRKQFIEGAVAYAGSDVYMLDDQASGELRGCEANSSALNLPVYISPIAVIFNVEGVHDLRLDSPTLSRIFKGEIFRWDDPEIARLNPDADLPDGHITVVYRSDDSGTTSNFTDYLAQTSGGVWTAGETETFPYSYAGAEGAQGTSGVLSAVSLGVNTIGYADASKVGTLDHAALQVGDEFIKYTPEGAALTVEISPTVEGRNKHDLALELDRNPQVSGAYPLVLVSYLIVCQNYDNPEDAAFIKQFLSFIVSPEGQAISQSGAGSAPISENSREQLVAAIDSIQ